MNRITRLGVLLTTLGAACLLHGLAWAQPTDNPYRTKYGYKVGHWTDSLPWTRVYNVTQFPGATDTDRFNAAQNQAHADGGGVIYFPAGTYTFEDNLVIKSGVIIRGETPAVTDAKDAGFAPPTRFEFPEYIPTFTGNGTPNSTAFKTITDEAEARNVAIVYVDINKAGVNLRPAFRSVTTRAGSTSWNAENNRNLMVFGVRSNNVAYPEGGVPTSNQLGWQRFCSRFSYNIQVFAKANSIIANCRVNDFTNNTVHPIQNLSYFQDGYLWERSGSWVPVDSGRQAPFSYTDHYGISANRKGGITFAEPDIEPDLFCPGVEVLDNWIYKTMRVGIMAAGSGLVVKGNVVRDQPGKRVWIRPQGTGFQTNNSATYENRGIDWSGWNVRLEENDVEVYKHRIANSNYPSVDGEGILMQECCGGTSINGAIIRKNIMRQNGGYIGVYKTRDIHQMIVDSNDMGGHPIWIWANTNGNIYALNSTIIKDNINTGNIDLNGSRGGSASYVTGNQGTGQIKAPCHVIIQNNQTFTQPACTPVSSVTYPEVRLVVPARDTVIESLTTQVLLEVSTTAGSPDSLDWYEGTTNNLLASTDGLTSQYLFNLPQQPASYRFFVRARLNTGEYTYSNDIRVQYCLDCTVTGLKSGRVEASLYQLFPQPSRNEVVLRRPDAAGTSAGRAKAQIVDMSGRNLQTQYVYSPGAEVKLDIQGLAPGLYQLLWQEPSGARIVKRLVVE